MFIIFCLCAKARAFVCSRYGLTKLWASWALLVMLATASIAVSAQPGSVSVCADPDPPPWTYWVRDAEGKRSTRFVGFSVDMLDAAFTRIGHPVRFIGNLPWARCLLLVEHGDIDFAMDAYYDEDRAKRFAYSIPYNTLTPQVFYVQRRPVVVARTADLKKYRGCGMIGASYAHYDLRSEDLDLGVVTYQAQVQKLKGNRCDYFVEELEVIAGFRLLGSDILRDAELQHGPVPGARAPAKHLLAGRGGAAARLMPEIDAALAELVRTGKAERFWRKHAGNLPYRPGIMPKP